MKELTYSAGDVVFFQGDEADTMYEILSGKVVVYTGYGTAEEIELTTLEAGKMFGEMAVLEKSPRSTTIVCVEDNTLLRELTGEDSAELLKKDPEFVRRIMRYLSDRLRDLTDEYEKVMADLKELKEYKKLDKEKHAGLLGRIKNYMKVASHARFATEGESLETLWGDRNRRPDRDASVRGRTPCEKGHPIFREGDKGEGMYYVYLGEVGIYVDFGGKNEKKITTVEEGGFFGEMGMIEHLPRTATAVAEDSGTYVEQIFEEDIDVLVEKTPEFVSEILAHLSMRLRSMTKDYYEACCRIVKASAE